MKKKNLFLIILFSIITLGIYDIYWFITLTNDSNKMKPRAATASGVVALLFCIITLGIYQLYWMYKLGDKVENSGVMYLIIDILGFGFIMMLVAQSKINRFIDAGAEVAPK